MTPKKQPNREEFPHVWRSRSVLPERFGQRCRAMLPADGHSKGFVQQIVFEDGFMILAARSCVHRVA